LLDSSQTLWGLVVSKSDGTIYRVKTGDYLGNENGKITNISEEKIEVLNLIPDNAGCFIDRQVSIALSSDPIK
jgi:type IV pilus assembly protein PilP